MCPRPEPAVMAAALEAGVTRLFRIGGAHAVAALAFGTETVPRVDKIVGPGNRYVAAAKVVVAGRLRDRFLRGPDRDRHRRGRGPPRLDRRRPHRAGGTRSRRTSDADDGPAAARHAGAPCGRRAAAGRGYRARRSIARRHCRDAIAGRGDRTRQPIAPEHLVVDRESLVAASADGRARCSSARETAQAAGDYATGSNHVLPTAGAARFRGGLSAADFVRVMSVQRVTRAGLTAAGADDVPLAHAEGLTAHAESIEVRSERNSVGRMTRNRPTLRRPAAAPEREHGRLLAACARGARAACGADQIGFYPPTPRPRRRARGISGVRPERVTLTNGLDEGIMASRWRISGRRIGQPRRPRGDRARTGLRDLPLRHGGRGRARCAVMPNPDFRFAEEEVLAAVTPRTRVVFLTNPNNPTGVVGAVRGHPQHRPARAEGSDRVRGRGVRRVRGSFLHSGAAAVSKCDRRPDVFQGIRACGSRAAPSLERATHSTLRDMPFRSTA